MSGRSWVIYVVPALHQVKNCSFCQQMVEYMWYLIGLNGLYYQPPKDWSNHKVAAPFYYGRGDMIFRICHLATRFHRGDCFYFGSHKSSQCGCVWLRLSIPLGLSWSRSSNLCFFSLPQKGLTENKQLLVIKVAYKRGGISSESRRLNSGPDQPLQSTLASREKVPLSPTCLLDCLLFMLPHQDETKSSRKRMALS